ncbi:MAG: hypothetical protein AB2L24_00945 [Mangrovibacterium sp.]
MGQIVANTPVTPVPFSAKKSGADVKFSSVYSYTIDNSSNAIPDKLYDNVQLTQYTRASVEPELRGVFFRKFTIPNSNKVLVVVSFGGVTDWRTDVICSVSSTDQILGTLEVAVRVTDVWVKQFRINAQNQIIVTTIKPTSTTSIPFGTFTSFSGYRQDITYSVNSQGQFVQESVQTYPTQTYTRSYLKDRSINLWE